MAPILGLSIFLFFLCGRGQSKKTARSARLEFPSLSSRPTPRGEQQTRYVEYLRDPAISVVAGVGSAGTGKTLFACHAAVQALNDNRVKKLILTRPIVSVAEENLGFLPGDISQKMNPWMLPMFDIFLTYFSQKELDKKINDGVIVISPLGFMRGRTFDDCFIIADESQNMTPGQMLMLITRIGNNSKMVLTGDLHQSDLSSQNGLHDFLSHVRGKTEKKDAIKLVEFDAVDVQRSGVVKSILRLYNL
jgi:phosphate starvation-inducible protein PhoH and related proteins